MGRSPSPFLYIRDQSGQLVPVQPKIKQARQETKKKMVEKERKVYPKNVGEKSQILSLDELDRTILESGVTTPQEAYKKLGILLMEAEARMKRSIPVKLEAVTFEEALEKYKKRLPMKI